MHATHCIRNMGKIFQIKRKGRERGGRFSHRENIFTLTWDCIMTKHFRISLCALLMHRFEHHDKSKRSENIFGKSSGRAHLEINYKNFAIINRSYSSKAAFFKKMGWIFCLSWWITITICKFCNTPGLRNLKRGGTGHFGCKG